MSTTTNNPSIPVKRLQLDPVTGALIAAPKKHLFLRGPIPLEWLSKAATLPGKTIHLSLALWWLHGMAKGVSFKLTQKSLRSLNVDRGATSAGLRRLEQAGLVQVERKLGQRPTIKILSALTLKG